MITAFNYIFMFFAYSACGWFGESLYRTIGALFRKGADKRIINSGFLYGPICPIYGTGALFFTVFLVNTGLATPDVGGIFKVFFIGMLLADVVEYVTSYLMEKLFNARWWDYSNNFLNLHGRICFKHSIIWGTASLLFVYGIHPLYEFIVSFIPDASLVIITAIILVLFAFDLVMTVLATIDVRKFIQKYNDFKNAVTVLGNLIKDSSEGVAEEMRDSIHAQFDKPVAALKQQLEELKDQFNRLLGVSEEQKASERGGKLFRKAGTLPKRIESFLEKTGVGIEEYQAGTSAAPADDRSQHGSDGENKKDKKAE